MTRPRTAALSSGIESVAEGDDVMKFSFPSRRTWRGAAWFAGSDRPDARNSSVGTPMSFASAASLNWQQTPPEQVGALITLAPGPGATPIVAPLFLTMTVRYPEPSLSHQLEQRHS